MVKGIVEGLLLVQTQLRLNGGMAFEPLKITLPILALLRAGLLAPYKLVALKCCRPSLATMY